MKVAAMVLPTCRNVKYAKFVGAKLDHEMLGQLTTALSDERSTVRTLALDWNPLEVTKLSSQ